MNYTGRIVSLKNRLKALSIEALLIESPLHILYLTGLDLSAGQLIISSYEDALIVDGRYYEKCSQLAPLPVFLQSALPLLQWVKDNRITTLAFEKSKTTYQRFEDLQSTLKGVSVKPVDSPVNEMRLIKEAEEIALLREAAQLNVQGCSYVQTLFKEGVREEEIALELELFWKKKGAKKLSFDPIIAFGSNSSMPHYRAGTTPLMENNSVLIDIGVVHRHYNSDMTRTLFFGKGDEELLKIYAIVEEAKNRALALCKPGICIGELDKIAREYITAKGYGDYFTHSLGHGVGLEIHEAPTLRQTGPFSSVQLQPGMVVTIEPGIYLPGKGGVRLEDTVVINTESHEILTN
ncbi:MAG: Xaa-Pro peptidase family protein [Parachlamydia sp.]|jgi:Xaa-Pro aminopeptidase|nr:Xaa-Pro peptidase family protein [Parachlamydia sp.]